jgi:hypothetical protein
MILFGGLIKKGLYAIKSAYRVCFDVKIKRDD